MCCSIQSSTKRESNQLVHYQPMLPSILMSCCTGVLVAHPFPFLPLCSDFHHCCSDLYHCYCYRHYCSLHNYCRPSLFDSTTCPSPSLPSNHQNHPHCHHFHSCHLDSLCCSFSTTSTVNTFLVAIFRNLAVACVKAELTSTTVRVQLQPLSCMCMNFINLLNFRYFCPVRDNPLATRLYKERQQSLCR